MRRSMSLLAMLLVLLALAAPSAVAQDEDKTTLVVGFTQPWVTLNPTVGFAVSEYEIWNMMYATLTDKAPEDFATIPGLAESWEISDDGLTVTYTLREGLLWSDGEPLTAEDVAWNINTARDQGWDNMSATVANLTAEATDDVTVVVTSAVPDPKLPALDVYLVPKHIWEPIATDYDATSTYDASDYVGSGPFVVAEYVENQFVRLEANENYWGGRPAIDEVVVQVFTNPDAMVAALQQGEIDAAGNVPAASMEALDADPDIVAITGLQGGFDEIAINGGQAEGQPHPALLDRQFRIAVQRAIDKQAVVDDLLAGYGEVATTISVGADLKWVPEIPEEEQFSYDPEAAMAILDEAGYVDTDGDGFREMPGGGENIVLRHAVNTDLDNGGAIGDLMVGWMNAIGIDVTTEAYDQDQLFTVIVEGTYDTFYWGWTPFVDPDPMLSYFTAAELGNYNDANWSSPEYDALYVEQNQELDPERRLEIVHQMVRLLYDEAVYIPLYYSPELQAYRTDKFEGWVRQPAEVGPVIFSNSSPSYARLTPIGEGGGGDGGGGSAVVPIAAGVGVVALAGVALAMSKRRKATADERE